MFGTIVMVGSRFKLAEVQCGHHSSERGKRFVIQIRVLPRLTAQDIGAGGRIREMLCNVLEFPCAARRSRQRQVGKSPWCVCVCVCKIGETTPRTDC